MSIPYQMTYSGPLVVNTKLSEEDYQSIYNLQRDNSVSIKIPDNLLPNRPYDAFRLSPSERECIGTLLVPYLNAYVELLLTEWTDDPHNIIDSGSPVNYNVDSMWLLYQQKGQYLPLHQHKGDISFAVYLDTMENTSTELSFMFNLPTKICGGHNTTADKLRDTQQPRTLATFRPSNGDMFIFPSYLYHRVGPNETDKERVVLAGNVSFT